MGSTGPIGSRAGVVVESGSSVVPEEPVAVGLASSGRGGDAESDGGVVHDCIISLCFDVAMAAMAEASMFACCSSSKTFQ